MRKEEKIENEKVNSIAKVLLKNFDKAGVSKYHQKKIISKASELLNL